MNFSTLSMLDFSHFQTLHAFYVKCEYYEVRFLSGCELCFSNDFAPSNLMFYFSNCVDLYYVSFL